MRVLIVGAGVAGPTLAYWLQRMGHEITLIERAPSFREGGYIVDFWGAGFDVADRMGIVPRLMDEGYRVREVREVSAAGRRIAHFDPRHLIGLSGGRFVSIARTDLARAIFDSAKDHIETLFGDTVRALDDTGDRVRVEFEHAAARDFDLVVGADGLHSRVRGLAFGPQADFERRLGITVAAFQLEGYPLRDELVAVMHTEVGAQLLRLSLRDDMTLFCLMFLHDGDLPGDDPAAQQDLLRDRLGHVGGEVPGVLDLVPKARTFYLDRASQIRMPSWSHGRVALIGDAAASPSLLAGQGSALAMIEAYVLAAALHDARGDHRAAFEAYERQLGALVLSKQDAALGMGAAFTPRNRAQLLLRNAVMGLMVIPPVTRIAMGRSLRDPIVLPDLAPL